MNKSILKKKKKEIFNYLILDKTTKDISEELGISDKTIRNHISNVIQKLSVKTRYQAVIELIKMGELNIK